MFNQKEYDKNGRNKDRKMYKIINEDCLKAMKKMPANSIDTIITDPPYGIKFMGKNWDHGIPCKLYWKEALRVAKPGSILMAFGGTRTFHRLTCAIEDAGWEIRDCMMYLYGSGFPKSLNISLALDKKKGFIKNRGKGFNTAGQGISLNQNKELRSDNPDYVAPIGKSLEAKQWQGYGTALKPAVEYIIVAMKPLEGTYVENAQKWGVAGLNIDGGRINYIDNKDKASATPQGKCTSNSAMGNAPDIENKKRLDFDRPEQKGRCPANLLLDEESARLLDEQAPNTGAFAPVKEGQKGFGGEIYHKYKTSGDNGATFYDNKLGGASRFFYCAKASAYERNAGLENKNNHPTLKPVSLMRYLCKLTKTPTGGVVLDPFMGSGSTGIACVLEGRDFIGIELNKEYCDIAEKRIFNAPNLKLKSMVSNKVSNASKKVIAEVKKDIASNPSASQHSKELSKKLDEAIQEELFSKGGD